MKDRTMAMIAYALADVLFVIEILIGLSLLPGGSDLLEIACFVVAVFFSFLGWYYWKRAKKEDHKEQYRLDDE